MVDDTLQKAKKDMYGMLQLCFYVNLCNLLESSTIIHAEKLTKKTTEVILNEILSTNKEENEDRIEAFAYENNIMCK